MTKEKLFDTYERYRDVEIENFKQTNRTLNGRGQTDFNAVAHALTSAGLVFNHGLEAGTLAGELREVRSIFDKDSTFKDSLRDNFNNKVGAAIATYAVENGLPESALSLLVKDALDRGLLAVSEHRDPRLKWHNIVYGKSYPELFDGPSPKLTATLEKTLGIKGLATGSSTGPGKPIEWLDLSGVTTYPVPRPVGTPGPNQTQTGASSLQALPRSPLTKPQAGTNSAQQPTPAQKMDKPPVPKAKPGLGKRVALNPFNLSHSDLRQQAELIEQAPDTARRMILASGRDPKLFGFT